MAARKPVNAIDVDGVRIVINSAYLKSWDGVKQAVEMQRLEADEEATNEEKFLAVFDYYNNAIENLDDVVESMGGGSVPFEQVFTVCAKALAGSSEKN